MVCENYLQPCSLFWCYDIWVDMESLIWDLNIAAMVSNYYKVFV
jgi:hypothetical protein